jgi:hypothetical protein
MGRWAIWSRREVIGALSRRLGRFALIAAIVGLAAGCATATPTLAPAGSGAPSPVLAPTRVPGGPSASPTALVIAGLDVDCGPLAEPDCRAAVAAFGPIALGATKAEFGGSVCEGNACPSVGVGALDASVILRWGEGDLTKILTCTRSGAIGTVVCERAPLDLG